MEYKGVMKFRVSHQNYGGPECLIQIDFEHKGIMDSIKGMVEFWSEWKERLEENKGDYVQTFLKQCGAWFCGESLNLSMFGIIQEYNNKEGWTPIDGSHGVQLLSRDVPEYEHEDFYVAIEK